MSKDHQKYIKTCLLQEKLILFDNTGCIHDMELEIFSVYFNRIRP